MSRCVPNWFTPQRSRGFTFVEIVIVVMVLGVLAGVAAPRYQAALAAVRLEAAAKRLAADLRHAQAVAVQTATAVTMTIDVAGSSYWSASLLDPDRRGEMLLVDFASRGEGLVIAASSFGGLPDVTFDFRGEPFSVGSVTLSGGGRSATVSVNQLGVVEVTL